ncbi:hypothetical protein [Spirillospora sp. CA-294931]|uniref:hypothetical protein n=1 Tax=Spirillospora sp. CA-294931 TaxID=3240042 RepID=UPI003D90E464
MTTDTERAGTTGTEELALDIARDLVIAGPPCWQRMEAAFALTATAESARVVFTDRGREVRTVPSRSVLAAVREHRALSAGEPWWRLTFDLKNTGELEVVADHGEERFPDDQLFPPEIYLTDLEAHPRGRLPVWLAAHVHHRDRQVRTPQRAAAAAREDRANGVLPVLSQRDFPDFPHMWARWATISAAFVACGSTWGPRVGPAFGWFEGAARSGSTLYTLPGGRAVLSGGEWDAPALDAAYNGGAELPALYAGAPDWVTDQVLNPRAARGMLSFCYWWEGGRWYRGESPTSDKCERSVPGVWTAGTVTDMVAGLIAEHPADEHRSAATALLAAAEAGTVTGDVLAHAFGDDGRYDIDGALHQFSLAGLTAAVPEQMPEEDAIARVRQYILGRGLDTTGYPLSELTADRFSVGWMVFVPVRPGEIAIGRALFYIADDGVLEQSSSSVAPSRFIAEFERRYHERQGA